MRQQAVYNQRYLRKQKRRRLRRIKAYFLYGFKIGIFILLVMFLAIKVTDCLKRLMEKNDMANTMNIVEMGNIEDTIGSDKDVLSTDTLLKAGYPESLVELYEKNPEAQQFVLDYLEYGADAVDIDISAEVTKGQIPLFLQWDERWGYRTYGDDFLAVTGCGPTCLSMVYCGLTGDSTYHPLAVAELADSQGYYVDGAGSSWDMMTSLAEELGLSVNNVIFDEYHIKEELQKGHPIICIMGPGTFTTSGHFIVLYGVDSDGNILVKDPNSVLRSSRSWNLEQLMPEINNLWSYSYFG